MRIFNYAKFKKSQMGFGNLMVAQIHAVFKGKKECIP